MGSGFYYPPFQQHLDRPMNDVLCAAAPFDSAKPYEDNVRVDNGRKAMCNSQHGAA